MAFFVGQAVVLIVVGYIIMFKVNRIRTETIWWKHNVLSGENNPIYEGCSHVVSEVQCNIVRCCAEGTVVRNMKWNFYRQVNRPESIKAQLASYIDDSAWKGGNLKGNGKDYKHP